MSREICMFGDNTILSSVDKFVLRLFDVINHCKKYGSYFFNRTWEHIDLLSYIEISHRDV